MPRKAGAGKRGEWPLSVRVPESILSRAGLAFVTDRIAGKMSCGKIREVWDFDIPREVRANVKTCRVRPNFAKFGNRLTVLSRALTKCICIYYIYINIFSCHRRSFTIARNMQEHEWTWSIVHPTLTHIHTYTHTLPAFRRACFRFVNDESKWNARLLC